MALDGYGPLVLVGLLTTIELAVLSIAGAFFVGIVGASCKLSSRRSLRLAATVYTTVIRSVPDLVMMLLLFYSLQMWLNGVTDRLGLHQIDIDPFAAGAITLSFIYGAYFTETFRGAFQAVPRGQLEAAAAYGMTPWKTFCRILFPQMMRHALPGIGNNWQVMIKATALVSLIGLNDLIKVTQDAGKASSSFFFFSILSAAIFLGLATATNVVVFMLERYFSTGVRRVGA
ncbi:ABC transporter permease [Ensifer adhaerens]|uniref:ABC transporter permease n=1 Tax=Ensifer canadensis TaxID=555315 RepID=UPI00149063E2|nr:ABC transporter permease [Ensifer canadensis]NOV16528.1 ABC transporter permease [Ensifer canadensis]